MTPGANAIAVIGMGGRFPDAPGLDQFWTNLRDGVESLRELSDEDLLEAGVPRQVFEQPNYVRSATVLDDVDRFDAEFFGFSPREAEIMDPQHRLFLESAWASMEDAGYVPGHQDHVVGVYASVTMNSYKESVLYRNPEVVMGAGGYQLMLGNDKDFLTTRVSYKLDLKGPSMVVQTACSSSLVAVEVAVQSLLANECDMALVGGSSITIPQTTGYLFQEGMIFSPDGHCRPFDARAGGIRAGHGTGVVVLKRLADAETDGDRIRAVILGAAINNDGAGKIGYTAPSVPGQAEVIAKAQAMAGIGPETIGYVETHGTGTRLGDPIEVTALSQVFGAGTEEKQFCGLGSLKSNLGHLDAAAGIGSLIKTVLALEHKSIPPSLNFDEPNPEIEFENSPFYVNDELRDWPELGAPRRAGVSSFGIGGTNAHVVLQEAPSRREALPREGNQIVLISAQSQEALKDASAEFGAFLQEEDGPELPDIAFTTQFGRAALPYRKVLVAGTREAAAGALTGDGPLKALGGTASETPGRAAFMFSGQGSQYPGMGKELHRDFPVYRDAFDRCMEICAGVLDEDLGKLILSGGENGEAEALQETRLTQPALFAVEYALARLWMSWGILPDSMIGHSIGEWVAAHLAGVFSLEDALTLVCERGRLMQEQPPGVMFSVSLPEQEVRGLLGDGVSIGAVNSPNLCSISGPPEAMDELAGHFDARDVPFRRLHTSHAFHSEMMDPVLEPFSERVAGVERHAPTIPFISNVSGTWITDDQARDPEYWSGQIRSPVRFVDGVQELARAADRTLLEVGPGQALTTFARQAVDLGSVARIVPSLPHAKDDVPSDRFALEALGRLWLSGMEPNWEAVDPGTPRFRVGLPTYPFQGKRYWVDPAPGSVSASAETGPQTDMARWFFSPSWARTSFLAAAVPDQEAEPQRWLLFDDGTPLGQEVAKTLRVQGQTVARVGAGQEFTETGEDEFTIDPRAPGDYDRLLETLKGQERLPNQILHMWTGPGSHGSKDPDTPPDVDRSMGLGFYSLMSLSQSLGRIGPAHPIRLSILTEGTVSVMDAGEVTRPENATLFGPAAVLPMEAPWIDCRVVDLAVRPDEDLTSLADSIVREAYFQRPATLVAYRNGHRWEPYYEDLYIGGKESPEPTSETNGEGVFLITGGLGSLGRAFARHLAARGPCTLVLSGRTEMPPRDEWTEILASEPDSRVSEVIRDIQELEADGHTVLTFAVDVGNEAEMSNLFEVVTRDHGPFTGILHAAGVPATGVLQLKTPELAASVLDPKVRGTLILDSLVGDRSLDFFVLFSSINAVLPAGGGSDYCSANAFLDAFAHYRKGKGDKTVLSLNWDTWQDIGMAVDTEVPDEMKAAQEAALQMGIPTEDGLEAFERARETGLTQVVVSRQHVPTLLAMLVATKAQVQEAVASSADPFGAGVSDQASGVAHRRPDLPQEYVAPGTEMEHALVQIWQALLGIEPIGVDDNFFELGGHSLLAVRVLAYLQEATGTTLPLEAIFEAPTIAQLAEQIETVQWMAEGSPEEDESEEDREEFVI